MPDPLAGWLRRLLAPLIAPWLLSTRAAPICRPDGATQPARAPDPALSFPARPRARAPPHDPARR